MTFAAGRVTVKRVGKLRTAGRKSSALREHLVEHAAADVGHEVGELAEVLLRLDATMLMVTHDLPFALQLCPRSIVLDDGAVVADGPTRELLADEELLRRHRLELPYGFVLS